MGRAKNAYDGAKAAAYSLLATLASCDHGKAMSKGYRDGWQMLMDRHDDNEMAIFCHQLPNFLSRTQATVLLDGLAKEYASMDNWLEFAGACSVHTGWKPSRESLTAYLERTGQPG